MNICAVSGRLAAPPIIVGREKTTMKLLVLSRYVYRREVMKEANVLVPCVIFDVSSELKETLLSSNYDEVRVELIGHIVRYCFENSEGEKDYNTEVVVDPDHLRVYKR